MHTLHISEVDAWDINIDRNHLVEITSIKSFRGF